MVGVPTASVSLFPAPAPISTTKVLPLLNVALPETVSAPVVLVPAGSTVPLSTNPEPPAVLPVPVRVPAAFTVSVPVEMLGVPASSRVP